MRKPIRNLITPITDNSISVNDAIYFRNGAHGLSSTLCEFQHGFILIVLQYWSAIIALLRVIHSYTICNHFIQHVHKVNGTSAYHDDIVWIATSTVLMMIRIMTVAIGMVI